MTRPSSKYQHMALDDFEELLADKPDDEKWELIGGRVVRLPRGVRWTPNRIVANVGAVMLNAFRRKGLDCRPFTNSFWLEAPSLNLAVFPDVIVRCGPLPPGATSLDEPVVLVDVVAQASTQRDRREKWVLYNRLPSLQHYVLIERAEIAVDVFDRVEGGFFERPRLRHAHERLALPAIDFEMPLEEIYREVLAE